MLDQINFSDVSVVIPSKNEAKALVKLLPELRGKFPDVEIIIVNDGSTDNTSELCALNNVREIFQPYSKGNGAAIKAGARLATGEILVFMDADGQHQPDDISRLLEKLNAGYDMVVGARDAKSQASMGRLIANTIYNKLSSWVVDQKIPDLTSGFRAVRADKFRQFLYLLPNGFSYPTTSTMAFFRAGLSVGYISITALQREGQSHINYLKDGMRFLLIIFKVASLYSPLKLFTPISMAFFFLGLIRYIYTYLESSTFTNMSALLFVTSVLIFLIGIVSEQITVLMYQRASGERKSDRDEVAD